MVRPSLITAVQKQGDVSFSKIRAHYMMPQKQTHTVELVLQGTCIFKNIIVVERIIKG